MNQTDDKPLAYCVLYDKTPIIDVYLDGTYRFRNDVSAEGETSRAAAYSNLLSRTLDIHETFLEMEEDCFPEEQSYFSSSPEYAAAFRVLRLFDLLPGADPSPNVEIQYFGEGKPWVTLDEIYSEKAKASGTFNRLVTE